MKMRILVVFKCIIFICALMLFIQSLYATTSQVSSHSASQIVSDKKSINELISEIKTKIKERHFQWDFSLFPNEGWKSHGHSVNGKPLIFWMCGDQQATNRALILSAVHGDENTPVYFGFRLVEYLKARPELCKDKFIVVAPIVNPDGFLRYRKGTRTNFNKVDLNRNFNTPDWLSNAHKLWKNNFKSDARRNPGPSPMSEPETVFQQWLIDEYNPLKILSVHAPLDILDYDGPKTPIGLGLKSAYVESCEKLRTAMASAAPLKDYSYGNFPGSLGNYAGQQKGIPTVTVELPTANSNSAALYFGMMEESTRVFLNYDLKNSPFANLEKSGSKVKQN